ncbi:LFA3 protein, partial [Centropus bengalensis]|nr:LFA3 protein [Centropus bengalensis]
VAHIHYEEVLGITGENVTFPVKIGQNITGILWTKNKNKVAEWEGQNELTYFPPLRGRGLLNKENGHLTIYKLEKNDTGLYEFTDFDSEKDNHVFMLSVLDPPPEPEISCRVSGDHLVLNCTTPFLQPLEYNWTLDNTLDSRHTPTITINKNAFKKAVCSTKISQTERSSEISLTQSCRD